MNIAICDDEENIRIYIRKLIQKQEPFCKITEFSSGKELLEFQDETNAEEIDILFLDISMGDEDGMTVAKQLRSQMESKKEAVWGSLPLLIFVTGYPALFVMGLGAALGAKVVGYFPNWKYKKYVILSGIGVLSAFGMTFSGNPYLMILGGFVGSFADDFLEVRTDILLNDMIPSEQRATLISVNSFTFSLVMIVMSTLMGSIM